MEFLTHLSPWHWWAIAILLLGIEIAAPSAFFLWPAVAAAIVGVVLWFQPHLGVLAQILVFGILASALVITLRLQPWRKRDRRHDAPLLNERAAQYVGRRALVVDAFRGGRGEVELDDTRWRAETVDHSDLPLGADVRIEAVEGMLLKVSPER